MVLALAVSLAAAAASFVAASTALLRKVLELRKLQQQPGKDAEVTATAPPADIVRFEVADDDEDAANVELPLASGSGLRVSPDGLNSPPPSSLQAA